MNEIETMGWTNDSWIDEDALPVGASQKVIRRNDPNFGLTEDEIEDRMEFVRCYLLRDFELILMIPTYSPEDDYFRPYLQDIDPDYSAFHSVDFQRRLKPFNKVAYAMKKIMERVKDLAILHSSVSPEKGRPEIHRRYEALVEYEFRSRLGSLISQFRAELPEGRRCELKKRIAELNRRILEARRIWERYAPTENWDH